MGLDSSFCDIVKAIQKDPFKKVDLTVSDFYKLQEHLSTCEECLHIVDEVSEKYKDFKDGPDSEWERTKYN